MKYSDRISCCCFSFIYYRYTYKFIVKTRKDHTRLAIFTFLLHNIFSFIIQQKHNFFPITADKSHYLFFQNGCRVSSTGFASEKPFVFVKKWITIQISQLPAQYYLLSQYYIDIIYPSIFQFPLYNWVVHIIFDS